jgi:hypothetical protein
MFALVSEDIAAVIKVFPEVDRKFRRRIVSHLAIFRHVDRLCSNTTIGAGHNHGMMKPGALYSSDRGLAHF